MPTKKKRVGFIPREDVMRLIDKLSIENNLSNSKIISILVEEALSIRGIFINKNVNVTQPYQQNQNNSQNLTDISNSFIDNSKFSNNTKVGNHFNPIKSTHFNEANHELLTCKLIKSFIIP